MHAPQTHAARCLENLGPNPNPNPQPLNPQVRIAHTLSDMSAPKTWEVADGTTVEVHTPFTTRAKELMQLYNGLRLPLLSTDERLDVLLHVKW